MSNIPRSHGTLLALAVCAALGFGVSTALASPAPPCPELAIGKCSNLSQCQNQCAQLGGSVAGARCDSGCCYCPLF